jgi:hypothetical protein
MITALVMTLLAVATIVLSVTVYYLIKLVRIQLNKIKVYQEWIVDLRDTATTVHRTMVKLDDKEMFQKDDEVGVVFKQLVGLINDLNAKVIDVDEEES